MNNTTSDIYHLHSTGFLPEFLAKMWREANGRPDPLKHWKWLNQELRAERTTSWIFGANLLLCGLILLSIIGAHGSWFWFALSLPGLACALGARLGVGIMARHRSERYASIGEYEEDLGELLERFFPKVGQHEEFAQRDTSEVKRKVTEEIAFTAGMQLICIRDGGDRDDAESLGRVVSDSIEIAERFGVADKKGHYYDIARKLMAKGKFDSWQNMRYGKPATR